jgi:two-component system OmpR family sensor kinase
VGEGSLQRRRVHVGKLLSEIVSSCELEHGDRRIFLSESNGLCVWADRVQLRSAIANVMRNALEYSPPGTPVNVNVDPSDGVEPPDGVVTLSISDRGPGIPEADRQTIFDPFVRSEGIPRRGDRGLGLFIARRVVEAHGGKIWVDSRGKGVTFKIGLPVGGAKG